MMKMRIVMIKNQNVSATSQRNTSGMNGNKGSGEGEASTVHQQ